MPQGELPNSEASLLADISNNLCSAEQIQSAMKAETAREGRAQSETQSVAGTITERKIANIWAEVLGIEQVGLNDNFFDLGGHSLMAVQIISRLHEAFGVKVPIDIVFNGELTVAALAREVEHQQISQAPSQEVAQLLEKVASLSDAEADELLNGLDTGMTGTPSH